MMVGTAYPLPTPPPYSPSPLPGRPYWVGSGAWGEHWHIPQYPGVRVWHLHPVEVGILVVSSRESDQGLHRGFKGVLS